MTWEAPTQRGGSDIVGYTVQRFLLRDEHALPPLHPAAAAVASFQVACKGKGKGKGASKSDRRLAVRKLRPATR